jgi:hypothetical protein
MFNLVRDDFSRRPFIFKNPIANGPEDVTSTSTWEVYDRLLE